VDDHALFRDGLKYVLSELHGEINIFEAPDSTISKQILQKNPDIDLMLVDLNIPGDNGFSLLEYCCIKHPLLPIVIVSASSDKHDISRAIEIGAMGYIPKNTTSKIMLSALQIVLAGEVYIPQAIIANHSVDIATNNNTHFTPKQLQVLANIIEGHSNKVIAYQMDIAEATIKMHVTAIMKKLGVSNRTQAALVAKERGVIPIAINNRSF
jgi:DNA-binding NarL/FixJ family response regulator